MKTKALICVFVFAYAKSRFSCDEAHLIYIVYFMQIMQDKKDFLAEEGLSAVSFVADILHVKEPISIYAYTY